MLRRRTGPSPPKIGLTAPDTRVASHRHPPCTGQAPPRLIPLLALFRPLRSLEDDRASWPRRRPLCSFREQTANLIEQVLECRRRSRLKSDFVYVAFCNANVTLGKRDSIVIDTMFEIEKPKALFAPLNRRFDVVSRLHFSRHRAPPCPACRRGAAPVPRRIWATRPSCRTADDERLKIPPILSETRCRQRATRSVKGRLWALRSTPSSLISSTRSWPSIESPSR